jgi:hypothetical protein
MMFFTEYESIINLVGWSIMLFAIFVVNSKTFANPIQISIEILATVAWVFTLFNVVLNGIVKGF